MKKSFHEVMALLDATYNRGLSMQVRGEERARIIEGAGWTLDDWKAASTSRARAIEEREMARAGVVRRAPTVEA